MIGVGIAALALLAACGSKTALGIEPPPPPDAGPPPVPMPEVCNGADDDLDGEADEGFGFEILGDPITLSDSSLDPDNMPGDLTTTSEGMLATWRKGFRGEMPKPTTFVRPLTARGVPSGEARLILSRPTTWGPRAAPSSRGRVVLTYCGRFGVDDVTTSVLVDERGTVVSDEVRRSPSDRNACYGNSPDGVWTGRRHLFGWVGNSDPGDDPFPALLDVADGDLRSTESRILEGLAFVGVTPRFAVAADGVGLVYEARRAPDVFPSELVFLTLDAEGRARSSPVRVPPPSPIDQFHQGSVAADDRGYLVATGFNGQPGLWIARFDRAGALVGTPGRVAGLPPMRSYGHIDIAARPGGFVLVGGFYGGEGGEHVTVMRLDREGALVDEVIVSSGDDVFDAWPAVVARGGRAYVLYGVGLATSVEVRIVELGCP